MNSWSEISRTEHKAFWTKTRIKLESKCKQNIKLPSIFYRGTLLFSCLIFDEIRDERA
jgi:hypothetical protein